MRWLLSERTNGEPEVLCVIFDLSNKKESMYALEYIDFIKKKELMSVEQQTLHHVHRKIMCIRDDYGVSEIKQPIKKVSSLDDECKT